MSEDAARPLWTGCAFWAGVALALLVLLFGYLAFTVAGISIAAVAYLAAGLTLNSVVVWIELRSFQRNEDRWLRVQLGNDEPRDRWAWNWRFHIRPSCSALLVIWAGYPLGLLVSEGAFFAYALGVLIPVFALLPYWHRAQRRYWRIHDGEEPLPEPEDASVGE